MYELYSSHGIRWHATTTSEQPLRRRGWGRVRTMHAGGSWKVETTTPHRSTAQQLLESSGVGSEVDSGARDGGAALLCFAFRRRARALASSWFADWHNKVEVDR